MQTLFSDPESATQRFLAGEAPEYLRRQLRSAKLEIDSVLNIPVGARSIDLLSIQRHGSKGGRKGILLRCKLFLRDGHLWILQGQRLFALPLDPTASLAFQKDGVFIHNWNQEQAAWRAEYRKAGVSTMQGEPTRLRYFCCLTTHLGQDEYRLLFPAYELQTMQELTGLTNPAPLLPEKLTPVFYWLPPKKAHLFKFNRKNELCPWEFSDQHPVAYGLFVAILFLALIVPMLAYLWCQMRLRTPPASFMSILIGEAGCFLLWAGLGSILSAWMKEYLGHIWTGLFLLVGSGLLILAGQF